MKSSHCPPPLILSSELSGTIDYSSLHPFSPLPLSPLSNSKLSTQSHVTLQTTLCEALLTLSTILVWNHSFSSSKSGIQGACGELFPQIIGVGSELDLTTMAKGVRGHLRVLGDCNTGGTGGVSFGLGLGGRGTGGIVLVVFLVLKSMFAWLYIKSEKKEVRDDQESGRDTTEYDRSHDLLIYSILIHCSFNLLLLTLTSLPSHINWDRAVDIAVEVFSNEVVILVEVIVVALASGALVVEHYWHRRGLTSEQERFGKECEKDGKFV